MIRYDCHTHTLYSSDSTSSPREQIEAAIALGLEGICITDHMDLEYPSVAECGYNFEFEIPPYHRELADLKEEYADRINVLIGIEFGLRNEPEIRERLRQGYEKIISEHQYDLVIGSTHCLEYTDPILPKYWDNRTAADGVRTYFEAILDNVKYYDCFDTCAHLDYLVRYIPVRDREGDIWKGPESYSPSDYAEVIDAILSELIRRGKALECNSAGYKYGLGFAHPRQEILRRYKQLGGELLTIGSDGHKPEHLAYDFKETCDMLKGLGYKYYSVYEARTPIGFMLF